MVRVIVPTDFSENADQAFRYARELFKGQECTIFLLHSYEKSISTTTSRIDIGKMEKMRDELANEAIDRLEKMVNSIPESEQDPKHKIRRLATSLRLPKALTKLDKKEDVDLVIMGTKGATGSKEVFMGSNTVKAILKSKGCPILAVPTGCSYEPIKKILLATGFNHTFSEQQLAALKLIAGMHQSAIDIIHIAGPDGLNPQQKKVQEGLLPILEPFPVRVEALPPSDSKADLIYDYMRMHYVDLLAMIYYRHNFIEKLTREPVIKKVGFSTETPFLVIPESN